MGKRKSKTINLKDLKYHPDNYRVISEHKLKELAGSLTKFPEMLEARPIIIDPDTMNILAGEMKVRALRKLGRDKLKEGEYKMAEDLTEEQKERLMIKDNLHQGEFDYEKLKKFEPDEDVLKQYGVNPMDFEDDIDYGDLLDDDEFDAAGKVAGMEEKVKRALQVPVRKEEYTGLLEGINRLRNRGYYVGELFIEALAEDV